MFVWHLLLFVPSQVLGEKPAAAIVAQMSQFLDRSLTLRLGLEEHDYADSQAECRMRAVAAMERRGFSALKRGVALYKRVKEAVPPAAESSAAATMPGEAGDGGGGGGSGGRSASGEWSELVLFSEAVECLLVYLKAPEADGKKKSPMVHKCVVEMLDRTEALKAIMLAAEAKAAETKAAGDEGLATAMGGLAAGED